LGKKKTQKWRGETRWDGVARKGFVGRSVIKKGDSRTADKRAYQEKNNLTKIRKKGT